MSCELCNNYFNGVIILFAVELSGFGGDSNVSAARLVHAHVHAVCIMTVFFCIQWIRVSSCEAVYCYMPNSIT